MSRGSWGAILPFTDSLHTDPIWRRCVAQPSRLPVCRTLLWGVIRAPVSLSKYYTLPECSRLQNSALTVTSTLPWAGLIQHLGHTEAERMTLWIKICYANFPLRKSPLPFASQAKHYSTISHCGWACTQSSFPGGRLVCTDLVGQGRELPSRAFGSSGTIKQQKRKFLYWPWELCSLPLSFILFAIKWPPSLFAESNNSSRHCDYIVLLQNKS